MRLTLWRAKRVVCALRLFTLLVWRETASGERMGILHAWQTAGVSRRFADFWTGLSAPVRATER